jgi:hypothetical protein
MCKLLDESREQNLKTGVESAEATAASLAFFLHASKTQLQFLILFLKTYT